MENKRIPSFEIVNGDGPLRKTKWLIPRLTQWPICTAAGVGMLAHIGLIMVCSQCHMNLETSTHQLIVHIYHPYIGGNGSMMQLTDDEPMLTKRIHMLVTVTPNSYNGARPPTERMPLS